MDRSFADFLASIGLIFVFGYFWICAVEYYERCQRGEETKPEKEPGEA